MKKCFILILLFLSIFIVGCSKNSNKSVIKNIKSIFDKSDGYYLKGNLSIFKNEDNYNYEVDVYFKKDDYYKVILTNKYNDHTQIILKNDEGVYVLTPALNKSFKFQSDWPNDNSQIYLLDALIKDIDNDKEYLFTNLEDKYEFITKVNYPNNSKFVKQKIVFDKKYKLKSVDVYDSDDINVMKFEVNKLNLSYKFSEDCFELDSIVINNDIIDDTSETSSLDDIIYPLYLPTGTKLVDESKVKKDNGERVIMTYDGEKSFLLVEETLDVFSEFTVIPSMGEPYQLLDTLGIMTDNSLSWVSGNTEYYLVSDVMSVSELLEVAESIVAVPALK